MRPRFPLSAKILLWFFANLLVIGIAAFAFIEFEFHLGPESLLGGRAGRRIDALAELVNRELSAESPARWNDVLASAGNLYGIKLLIAAPDGHRIAGADIPLPDMVLARLFRPRPPQRHPPLRPDQVGLDPDLPAIEKNLGKAGQGPDNATFQKMLAQAQASGPPPQGPDDFGPLPPPDGAQPPPGPDDSRRPPPPPLGPREHRMIHTQHPDHYWLILPLDAPGMRPPLNLVAVSDSVGLGGLVVDFVPWIAAAAGVLLFSVLFWLPLVHGITRSIREMTSATARVAEGRFDVTVRESRGDELGLLAHSVNQMSARLRGFVDGQKRFLGDIAHELCSPLARAQVALGILEHQSHSASTEDLREEIQQMSSLVNELLSFSKASLAAGHLKLQSLPLREVVAKAIERENISRAAIHHRIGEDLWVTAEPDLLCRAISNLLRNAVKYAGDHGPIEAEAERVGHDVVLNIFDHGPGVPEESLPQLFDPFYRVDASRARETGGVGLGLAIVKTCVESCGGRVSCQNRLPHGLAVTITLPAA